MIMDIATGAFTELELEQPNASSLNVGRFYFDEHAFAKARAILLQAKVSRPDWLIIDEVGKLEILQERGFEPVVSDLVELYKSDPAQKLLLVIRDSLLEDAIQRYDLNNASIIHDLKTLGK